MEQQQQFAFDSTDNDNVIPREAYKAMMADILAKDPLKSSSDHDKTTSSSAAGGRGSKRKSFVADNGTKYYWDDEEECWVEDNEENNDSDKEQDHHDGDSSDEAESDEEKGKNGIPASEAVGGAVQKRKRNKKKKAKKAAGNWVYVTGLPLNVTVDEVKNHFSKVRVFVSTTRFTYFVDNYMILWFGRLTVSCELKHGFNICYVGWSDSDESFGSNVKDKTLQR
jgi:hypothetical protein